MLQSCLRFERNIRESQANHVDHPSRRRSCILSIKMEIPAIRCKLSKPSTSSATATNSALPESVSATVSYRIAPHDSLDIVKDHITRDLEPVASKHKIQISGFGEEHQWKRCSQRRPPKAHRPSCGGTLYLTSLNDLFPSPISPISISNLSGISSAALSVLISKTYPPELARKWCW